MKLYESYYEIPIKRYKNSAGHFCLEEGRCHGRESQTADRIRTVADEKRGKRAGINIWRGLLGKRNLAVLSETKW